MTPLPEAVEDYVAMRRGLGYQLTEHGRVLPQFARFLEQRGESLITTTLALQFAMLPARASVVWWHQRLAIVRGFAHYLHAFDARHEIPPVNLLPATARRARPYLFSDAEIQALLEAARSLRPPLRAASCEALIGLLAVSGMRVSEACGLGRADVELIERRLTVRHAKNGRSREIPLHPSTVAALERYARTRDELCPVAKDPDAFFLSGAGGRVRRHFVWKWFDQLRHATGLDQETLGRCARLHDIRHAYALRTLIGWYRDGGDIEARMPLLSTMLGHVRPADTLWYLEATPELLALACERLERSWQDPAPDAPPHTRVPASLERSGTRARQIYRRGGRR